MKTCRTNTHNQTKKLRSRNNISKDEVERLKVQHLGDFLPEGWFFDGTYYLDYNGNKEVVHPNLDGIIQNYIDMQNDEIGGYNREVQKFIKMEKEKYESF